MFKFVWPAQPYNIVYEKKIIFFSVMIKVVKHIEMSKAGPQKSICHFQKLEMILKWNKQNTVRWPLKNQFLLKKHKINC